MAGNAVNDAGLKLRALLFEAAAEKLGVPVERLATAYRRVYDLRRSREAPHVRRGREPRRGEARHARRGGQLQQPPAGIGGTTRARASAPRRRTRTGARRRGQRRPRDGHAHGRQDLDRARLRPRAEPGARRGPDRGLGLHGLRRDHRRGADLPRRPAQEAVAARLQAPDVARHAGARGAHRRDQRHRGSVRREGGGRGSAALGDPGDRERGLRRDRRALRRNTDHRGQDPRRARQARQPRRDEGPHRSRRPRRRRRIDRATRRLAASTDARERKKTGTPAD